MLSLIKKIVGIDPKNLTTSHIGILQAHAYRVLKSHTNKNLAPYDIQSMEWAVLGMLSKNESGLRNADIAEVLGVKKPFVTRLIAQLVKKGLVTVASHTDDKRVRTVLLTTKGRDLIPMIEKEMRSSMRGIVEGASHQDLVGYIRVLEAITKNNEK